MSTLISEAWGEIENHLLASSSAGNGSTRPTVPVDSDGAGATEQPKPDEDGTRVVLLQVLNELQHLREEQASRCATQLVLAAILAALVLMYVNRLHTQYERLLSYHHPPQYGGFAHSGPHSTGLGLRF